MVCDRCNCYFLFGAIFCPFTPLRVRKIQISKKWNKRLEISSFYSSVPKLMIICCTVPEIWCVTDVTVVFYFGLFYPSNSLKNQNFKKNEKKSLEISSFYTCVPKMIIGWRMVPEIWYARDGRMDRWTDKNDI